MDMDFATWLGSCLPYLESLMQDDLFYRTTLFIFGLWLFLFLMQKNRPKILGVYSQPGKYYYFKYYLVLMIIRFRALRRWLARCVGGAQMEENKQAFLERPQPLHPDHPMAVDAVFFNGSNENGVYFAGGIARRHDRLVQTLCLIRLPGFGLLTLPIMPDTACVMKQQTQSFVASGFTMQCVRPMSEWNLTYYGKMKLYRDGAEPDDEPEEVIVAFDLTWNAVTRYFDFDTDLDRSAVAQAIATEPWSKAFFENLKGLHQSHYEQYGTMSGLVHLTELETDIKLNVTGVRDHSFGNERDWADFHRYALQFMTLKDGSFCSVGSVCMPKTTSRLILGFVMEPNGSVSTVSSSSLQLFQTGEDGNDPDDCAFHFTAGGREYLLEVSVVQRAELYYGNNWEARIVERMCRYKLNGVEGWGFSEFEYRNLTGKPVDSGASSISLAASRSAITSLQLRPGQSVSAVVSAKVTAANQNAPVDTGSKTNASSSMTSAAVPDPATASPNAIIIDKNSSVCTPADDTDSDID